MSILSFLIAMHLLSAAKTTAWHLQSPAMWTTSRHAGLLRLCPVLRLAAPGDSASETDVDHLRQALQKAEEADFENFLKTKVPKWTTSLQSFPFECTSCGKCCKTQGSVYLSPDDAKQASQALGIGVAEFVNDYASHTLSKADGSQWIRLRERDDACIFLNEATNHCEIYQARPSQCRTYPFWPSILMSRDSWNAECRRPETTTDRFGTNDVLNLPMWTPEDGGCEGMRPIGSSDAVLVPGITAESDKATVTRVDGLRALYDNWMDSRRFPATVHEAPIVRDT